MFGCRHIYLALDRSSALAMASTRIARQTATADAGGRA